MNRTDAFGKSVNLMRCQNRSCIGWPQRPVAFIFLLFISAFSVAQSIPPSRDPKYNSTINPTYNSTINPRYNSTIDPKYNSTINPKYNSTINPKYNSTIDPKYNSTINPKYNSTINPKYNSSIDPRTSANLRGHYLFNPEAELIGIFIIANKSVMTWYSPGLAMQGIAVSDENGGFNVFDMGGEWLSYFSPNGDDGFNLFSLEGEWLGFVT